VEGGIGAVIGRGEGVALVEGRRSEGVDFPLLVSHRLVARYRTAEWSCSESYGSFG